MTKEKKCEKCGGSRRIPQKHCKLGVCVKTHERITCSPDGITCEYYIAGKPCPACSSPSQEPRDPYDCNSLAVLRVWLTDALSRLEASQKEIERQAKITKLLHKQLDRVPLCPDCRDKVHDLPCLRCTIQQLQADNKRLREALEKYGDHLGTCYKNLRMGGELDKCNCGLAQALKEKP